MTTSFLVTSLVIVATPGTGALYAIAAGLTRGARASVLAAFAGVLGAVPHLVAALTGLAALLHASGVAFGVVKYAGVAYLLYMAWATWRDTGALSVADAGRGSGSGGGGSAWRVLGAGITLNLLNPKLTIFFVAFLPQFVPAGDGAVASMLALGGVFMVMTFVVFAGYGVCAAVVRDRVLQRPRVLRAVRRTFAATFAALAARLAVEPR
ncbi:LysE family translocator [Nocardioides sp. SYSU DS0651]|uniref:LysE family translocator n=1 Tax=Nocardioides sp. SYSU DS0651 TaxID=3415955 RepID=UPI003F4BBC1D